MTIEDDTTTEETEQETLVDSPDSDTTESSKTVQERIDNFYESPHLHFTFLGIGMKLFTEYAMVGIWIGLAGIVLYTLSHFGMFPVPKPYIVGGIPTFALTITAASWCSTSITMNEETQ